MTSCITNKHQSAELFKLGKFGNKTKLWSSIDELRTDRPKLCMLRYRGNAGGMYCHYDVTVEEAENLIDKYVKENNAERARFFFNETAIHEKLLIQGELYRSIRGLEFRYSLVREPMRLALDENEQTCYGLKSISLLKHYLTSSSYTDLMELIELYPDHVFELSVWSYDIGDIPGRNAIVWEVRKY